MTTADPVTADALVEQIVASRPDDPALVSAAETVSFADLVGRSHALAETLRAAGVGTETPVAVALPRSVAHVVATLAIWFAGGVCVPVEPALPERRIAQLLAASGAECLIGISGAVHRLSTGRRADTADRTADSLAYVFFTSGSTGTPKAVGVPHSGIVNEALWTRDAFALGPGDRCGWLAAPTFALTRWAVWSPLVAGAAVRIAADGVEWTAPGLRDWLVANGVTWTVLVTSLGEQLLALPWPASSALRTLVIGGEQLRSWPGSVPFDVVNSYGITETCVRIAAWLPSTEVGALPSIGAPVANTTVRVLDDDWRPVPRGEMGELFIGGAGLARGYLGSSGLTAARFVPDPDAPPGARMYRTGDLVRIRATGELEYVGRSAGDYKVNGVRVNLAEIEAALLAQPSIEDACVVIRSDGGDWARLVAYVVSDADNMLVAHEIVDLLGEQLPSAMIPERFVRLARIPRLVSGKADRVLLPVPDGSNELSDDPVAPRDEMEAAVAAAFMATLAVPSVGVHDDYLRLGGTSLGLFRVRELLATRLGVRVSIAEIFERRTAARMATLLRDRPTQPDPGPFVEPSSSDSVPQTRTTPLSHAQRRIWFVEGLRHQSAAHAELVAVEIGDTVYVDALRVALGALVERHEVLRSTVAMLRDEPVSVVHPRWSPPLTVIPEPVTDDDVPGRLANAGLLTPFDLRREQPVRFALLSGRSGEQLLAVVVHHIAWDGGSAEILVTDLAALYEQAVSGVPHQLPRIVASYADHVLADRQEEPAADRPIGSDAYWLRQLHGVTPITWRHPATQSGTVGAAGVIEMLLPTGFPAALRDLAASTGYTSTMLGAAAAAAALRPLHTDDSVTICMPVATRDARTRSTIGLFLNLVLLRLTVPPATTWRALLAATRTVCLDAWEHSDLPFERIVRGARLPGRAAGTDLSRVTFEHVRLPDPVPGPGGGQKWRLRWYPGREPKTDLFVGMIETAEDLLLRVLYDPLVLCDTDIRRYATELHELLRHVVTNVDAPVPPPFELTAPTTVSGTPSDTALWSAASRAWCDALGVGAVDADDSFFDLGGDETGALRITTALGAVLDRDIPLRAVFDSESFDDFVRAVASPSVDEGERV